MKLGKTPARPGAVKLKLVDYLDTSVLPKAPATFGHDTVIGTKAWGMLANDSVGDCVIAGQSHAVMQWNEEVGVPVPFTPATAIKTYSAITGYNPKDPNTDQGTDMQVAASYWQKTGMVDGNGKAHKIGAYVAIEPGNLTQLYYALYLFNGAGIGINFPASAMDQFNAGKEWSVVKGASIEGGHYIWGNRRGNGLGLVTWGTEISMTLGFYDKYNDESLAYISQEYLSGGKSLEGFNVGQLTADLAALKN